MTTHCQTHVGVQRSANEDAAECTTIDGVGELVAVADGMGGHPKGGEASETAIATLISTITTEAESDDVDHEELLETGFHAAHDAVTDVETNGSGTPGTTLVAALVDGETATIANVGDSRAYAVDDSLEQVTIDQSQVQQLLEAGEITPEEAADHPMSHVLAQAMGTADDLEVDVYEKSVDDTWLLLCSDGLCDPVPDEEIGGACLETDSIEAAGTALVEHALDHGGPDNVTVGLYASEGEEEQSAAERDEHASGKQ
jgi:serine/threonine protein phosphatase PrpC